MKFTQIPTDTFSHLQLNAGLLLKSFAPSTGTLDKADIIGATSGGVKFASLTPERVAAALSTGQWYASRNCSYITTCSDELLDELGVEYMSVTRLGGRSRHYWTIVNIGTGWYHFDAINYYKWNRCFMWTDAQCAINEDFWRYDSSLYPELATERFDYETVVQAEKAGLLP